MSVTRTIPIDTDYTDGNSSGGNGSGGNQRGDGGIEDDPLEKCQIKVAKELRYFFCFIPIYMDNISYFCTYYNYK